MRKLILLLVCLHLICVERRDVSEKLFGDLWGSTIYSNSETERFQEWGDRNLKSGDLIYCLGETRLFFGTYPLSKNIARFTNSLYSHVGIVFIESGRAYVYDITDDSIRKKLFGVYLSEVNSGWCVQRCNLNLNLDQCFKYIQELRERRANYDYSLGSDDSAYYCVELAVKTYKAGGVNLGLPTPLILIPNAKDWLLSLRVFGSIGNFDLTTPVWYIGNEKHGIMSSNYLSTKFCFKSKRDL
jgi:hypothetical protein